jgi:RsiW-degrading membrane proteinase PrsW (M82 family)
LPNRIRAAALVVAAAAQWIANLAVTTTFSVLSNDIALWFAYGVHTFFAALSFAVVLAWVRGGPAPTLRPWRCWPSAADSGQPPERMPATRDGGPSVLTPGLKKHQKGEMNQVAAVTTDTNAPEAKSSPHRSRRTWPRILLGGLALWVATVLVTFVTQNSNLIPTIIMLGSFLVPVTFVTYAFDHANPIITAQRIFAAFVVGGVLGVLGASLLEAEFLKTPSASTYVAVGLIEEAVKLAALWLLARRLPRYSARDGMVLGATVGLGFAAFESAGYAFNALFTTNGLSLLDVVETEVLRGILTPIGHGVWTGILGGAMFAAASRHWRLRATAALLGWYLGVALLHALWDASAAIAVWLTLLLTNTPMQWLIIEAGHAPRVSPAQAHIYTILNWALLGLVGLFGLVIFIRHWRRAGTSGTTPTHRIGRTGRRDAAIVAQSPSNTAELAAPMANDTPPGAN